ncbi:P-loop containing nucleoside triphosphate hydrolase protein [Mrakia frigida]|uniref:P-loop containing nucleoside triphosphate hydrolase protein n=1 Tax=Mrakia frigida TaxID=29902 RepID=UPI003FCC1A34
MATRRSSRSTSRQPPPPVVLPVASPGKSKKAKAGRAQAQPSFSSSRRLPPPLPTTAAAARRVLEEVKPSTSVSPSYQLSTKNNTLAYPTSAEGGGGMKESSPNHIYTSEDDTMKVYETSVRSLVLGAVDGVDGTVFAYGATGSGKTHTLTGNLSDPGIIHLATEKIFEQIEKDSRRQFTVHVSCSQIYVSLRSSVGESIDEARVEVVVKEKNLRDVIKASEKNRTTRATAGNAQSSRSHSILTMSIQSSDSLPDSQAINASSKSGTVRSGCLTFVDLAGSEATTVKTGDSKKDAESILLTLRNVIGKIVDNQKNGQSEMVPFRNSKLTGLLQSSLSGKSRLVFICNVSLDPSQVEQTIRTLDFAEKVSLVLTRPAARIISTETAEITLYKEEISTLKKQLEEQVALGTGLAWKQADMEQRAEDWDRERRELQDRLAKAESLIIKSGILVENPKPPSPSKPSEGGTVVEVGRVGIKLEAVDEDSEVVPISSHSRNQIMGELPAAAQEVRPRSEQVVVAQLKKRTALALNSLTAFSSLNSDSYDFMKPKPSSTSQVNGKTKAPGARSPAFLPTVSRPAVNRRLEITFNLHTALNLLKCFPLDPNVITLSGLSSSSSFVVIVSPGQKQEDIDFSTGKGFEVLTSTDKLYIDAKGAKQSLRTKKGKYKPYFLCCPCSLGVQKPKNAIVFATVSENSHHYRTAHPW